MRRTLILAAVLLAAGCTADRATDPPAAPPTTAEPTPVTAETAETLPPGEPLYVTVTRTAYPDYYGGLPASMMIDAVESTCAAFNNGATGYDIAQTAAESANYDPGQSEALGFLLGAGVEMECPEHSSEFAAL